MAVCTVHTVTTQKKIAGVCNTVRHSSQGTLIQYPRNLGEEEVPGTELPKFPGKFTLSSCLNNLEIELQLSCLSTYIPVSFKTSRGILTTFRSIGFQTSQTQPETAPLIFSQSLPETLVLSTRALPPQALLIALLALSLTTTTLNPWSSTPQGTL